MNAVDLLLIAALAVVIGLAARRVWKTRKTGGCGCDGCAAGPVCKDKTE